VANRPSGGLSLNKPAWLRSLSNPMARWTRDEWDEWRCRRKLRSQDGDATFMKQLAALQAQMAAVQRQVADAAAATEMPLAAARSAAPVSTVDARSPAADAKEADNSLHGDEAGDAVAEWEAQHTSFTAAIATLRAVACEGSAAALEERLVALGPKPERPPPTPWAATQRARRAVAKFCKKDAGATQRKAEATATATAAATALQETDDHLVCLQAELEDAVSVETNAIAALQVREPPDGSSDRSARANAQVSAAADATGAVFSLTMEVADCGLVLEGKLAGAFDVTREALVASPASPVSSCADADAVAVRCGHSDEGELCDSLVAHKRSCPDDHLNASGARPDTECSDVAGWQEARSRCRRRTLCSGSPRRSASEEPLARSRSPLLTELDTAAPAGAGTRTARAAHPVFVAVGAAR